MAARLVSITLIFAIIICPLGCGASVGCCAADDSVSESETIQNSQCHCQHCGESSSDSENENPSNTPAQPDHNKPCQGICGGAVLDKPALPAEVGHTFLYSWIESESTISDRTPERFADIPSHDCLTGRTLRTLQMSFLC